MTVNTGDPDEVKYMFGEEQVKGELEDWELLTTVWIP